MKDIYVQFKGRYTIDGESRDSEHSKWLEVSTWSHDIRQPKSATSSSAGGHTSERTEHGEMVFTKDLDLTSPKLWEASSAGYTFDEVTIEFFRADGSTRVKYLAIKLKNALISEVTPVVNSEGLPTETFKLKYAAVQWIYQQQKIEGGGFSGSVTTAWSLAKNVAKYEV
jgi:type VI secretion system secreted protein Hcp